MADAIFSFETNILSKKGMLCGSRVCVGSTENAIAMI
jgi:hypothetical protein